jgi:hypothetical protein
VKLLALIIIIIKKVDVGFNSILQAHVRSHCRTFFLSDKYDLIVDRTFALVSDSSVLD